MLILGILAGVIATALGLYSVELIARSVGGGRITLWTDAPATPISAKLARAGGAGFAVLSVAVARQEIGYWALLIAGVALVAPVLSTIHHNRLADNDDTAHHTA
jgi:hypothetical protein